MSAQNGAVTIVAAMPTRAPATQAGETGKAASPGANVAEIAIRRIRT